MLIEFLKSIKDSSTVYFILNGVIISGEIMKVDYEKEYVQLKTVTFPPHGLAVPYFAVLFSSIQAWGIRPKGGSV